MANEQMTELWNGPVSAQWVTAAQHYDAMLGELGELALQAAGPQPGERVLDVGCGSGALARAAAAQVGPTGSVLGVDVSAPMLELAGARPARDGAAPLSYLRADAQTHGFAEAAYDVLLSRFGVMFFDDPVAAFANLRRATAPGGRLAFVAWQEAPLNEWVLVPMASLIPHVGLPELPPPGAPGPFAFGDEARLRSVLADAGWSQLSVEPVRTTVLLPGSVEDVARHYEEDTFGQLALAKADPAQRAAARAGLREALAPYAVADGVRLGAAAWLVTARA